jgi:hypothetical protein
MNFKQNYLYDEQILSKYLTTTVQITCYLMTGGLVDWYRGYGATTPSHLGRKLAGSLCTAFSSARQPQRRSTSSDMRALW